MKGATPIFARNLANAHGVHILCAAFAAALAVRIERIVPIHSAPRATKAALSRSFLR